MPASTLNAPEESAPGTGLGHGMESLGPSDSTDTGSDVAGAARHPFDIDSDLDRHGVEIGSAELASGTDRGGTGERASADGDSALETDQDIMPDRIIDEFGDEALPREAGEFDMLADDTEVTDEQADDDLREGPSEPNFDEDERHR